MSHRHEDDDALFKQAFFGNDQPVDNSEWLLSWDHSTPATEPTTAKQPRWNSQQSLDAVNDPNEPASDDSTDPMARWATELHELPLARQQLVMRIRRQLAEGSYPEEDALELALDRMMDDIISEELDD